jgi:hypothetical protein
MTENESPGIIDFLNKCIKITNKLYLQKYAQRILLPRNFTSDNIHYHILTQDICLILHI